MFPRIQASLHTNYGDTCSLVELKAVPSEAAGRVPPSYFLSAKYTAHFHSLLHSYTRCTTFHRYLEIYFRATLPPLERVNFNSSSQGTGRLLPAAMKPHKELHRLGYLPRYSSMLVDLAYERIKRLVQSEGDVEPDVDVDEEEEDVASWSRPMLGILRKEVQRQVVAWLYIYINGKPPMRPS